MNNLQKLLDFLNNPIGLEDRINDLEAELLLTTLNDDERVFETK